MTEIALVLHRRPGTVTNTAIGTVPGLQRTAVAAQCENS
jgi:hypothetical protein